MTVAQPQAFVNDESSKAAVEVGIATSFGVPTSAVDATLTIGGRRISARGRVLQDGAVNVDARIEAEDAAAAENLETRVAAIEPETVSLSLTVALTVAGISSDVTVTTITANALIENSEQMNEEDNEEEDDDVFLQEAEEAEDWEDSGARGVGSGAVSDVIFQVAFVVWMLRWLQVPT